MKTFIKITTWLLVAIVPLLAFRCHTTTPEPNVPIYSYKDSIINPPDDFKISFDVNTYGDRAAYVVFSSDAVWQIIKTGDSRANFWIKNQNGDNKSIINQVTFGLKGNVVYTFVANNNNYDDMQEFFCRITKQPDDYETYEPKF
jgi:hypothetical protein